MKQKLFEKLQDALQRIANAREAITDPDTNHSLAIAEDELSDAMLWFANSPALVSEDQESQEGEPVMLGEGLYA